MTASVYKMVFRHPNLEKIVSTCKLYLVHLDTMKLLETTSYVVNNDGSVLLPCNSTLALDLRQPRSRLDYLPSKASLINSMQDQPKKTRQAQPLVHRLQQVVTQNKQEVETTQTKKQLANKLIARKDQIMIQYPDVLEGIGQFLGPPYTIHLDPSIQPKQTPCWPVPIYLKESFKKEIDKMLQVSVLKPVTEATPWIERLSNIDSTSSLDMVC